MATACDTLLSARYVLPVEGTDGALEHHSVAITAGKIVEVLPTAEAAEKYEAAETVELPTQCLMPGLVNTHTHSPMTMLRGLADDLPLMEWLTTKIFPAEGKHVSPEFVADGTRHAAAEMLRSGTTCFNDMYFFPESQAEVIEEVGIRANLGMILLMFPTVYASGPPEYIEKGKALHASLEASGWAEGRLTLSWAPHAPYTVTDENWMEIKGLCEEMGVRLHTHLHETKGEVESVQQRSVSLDAGSDAGLLLLLAEQVLLCAGHGVADGSDDVPQERPGDEPSDELRPDGPDVGPAHRRAHDHAHAGGDHDLRRQDRLGRALPHLQHEARLRQLSGRGAPPPSPLSVLQGGKGSGCGL